MEEVLGNSKVSHEENKRSLTETGGSLLRNNPFSELEQVVDRTLFLSKAAAPSGKVFGFSIKNRTKTTKSIDDCFVAIKNTPPRTSKAVAVVTPSRSEETSINQRMSNQSEVKTVQCLHHQDINEFQTTSRRTELATPPSRTDISSKHEPHTQQQYKRQLNIRDEPSISSSSKKRKTFADEQLALIRRQLKVGEQSAAYAKDQVDVTQNLVEATKSLASAVHRMADAAEHQIKMLAKIGDTLQSLVNFSTSK